MPPLFFPKSRSPPSSRKAGVCWQETPPASASPPNEDRLELSLQNNVLRRAGRGCATSNQPKLNCARHRPSPAVASSKVSLWMQLLAWESTTCPDGARKSVSVWHFGFDQHLLTTNSLSLSMTARVGCGKSNQEREAMVCRIPIDFFSRYVSRRNHSTVKACCPNQLCCEQILSPTLPGLWTKSTRL